MKKLSVKSSWLLICALGILITSISFLFYSFYVKNAVLENEKNTALKETSYVQTMLDDTWNSIFDLSVELYLDQSARLIETAKTPQEFYDLGAYHYVQEMKNYIVFNPFLEDIMIYYPSSDYVVGSFGVYPSHVYWLVSSSANPSIEFEAWKSTLLSYRDTGYFTAYDGSDYNLFLSFNRTETHNWQLTAKINKEEINKRLQWAGQGSSNSFIAVVDENGYIYGSVGNLEEFIDPATNKLRTTLDKSYISTQKESSIDGIYYLIITEKSSIHRLSSTVQIFAFIVLIVSCLISAGTTYVLIRQHSMKLDHLVSVFEETGEPLRNEYDLLDKGIKELIKNQEELTELSIRQQIIIEQSFLNELLFNNTVGTKNAEDLAAYYNIPLENRYCAVVAQKSTSMISDEQITQLMLSWSDSTEIFWIRKEELDIFVINFDDASGRSINTFLNTLNRITPINLERAISSIVDTPLHIGKCWIECAQQLNCLHLLGAEYKNDTLSIQADKLLDKFLIGLQEKDFESLHELAPALFDNYINNSNYFLFSCRKHYLANLIIPYCSDEMLGSLERMVAAQSKESWLVAFNYVLAVCNTKNSNTGRLSEKEIASKVRNMIDLQYNNPALDLRMLADSVGYSQSYTSRVFKEKFGINISQYINQVRINVAKEMILKENDNIKEIAIKVGFAGDTQFIRTFKRLEKMTPGLFRNANLKSNSSENDQ